MSDLAGVIERERLRLAITRLRSLRPHLFGDEARAKMDAEIARLEGLLAPDEPAA